MKLDIQLFADGKVVIDTDLNTKNFEKGLDKMQSVSKKAGSTIKNIVVGLGLTKLISTAMTQISNSLDGAISRLDTLNNFPKVMSNLGISAEDSEKSIKKMSDKLAGLPTTLDEGARAVQRFTSKNNDVSKSTDLFLALNNAILAGGAGAEIQSSALEQLSQAYAKGKPDMMEWRTAMMAMPAQLKQVAVAMGYVDADQLGEALREGTVSMDEFMDTITKLNTEGVNGFQSFEQQARNSTGGIKTAITVAKTQVVKGVADIIQALDIKLEELGIGRLNEIIANLGVNAKAGLDGLAELISGDTEKIIVDTLKKLETTGPAMIENITSKITEHMPKIIETAGNIIRQFVETINANLPSIINSAIDIITTFVNSISKEIPTLIPKLIETLMTALLTLTSSDNLQKIADAGVNLLLSLIKGIINTIPNLISSSNFTLENMFNVLSGGKVTILKIGIALLKALINGIINTIPELVNAGAKIVKSIADKITSLLGSLINKGKEILNAIKNGIVGAISGLASVGKNIVVGLWNGISGAKDWIVGKVKNFAKGILDSMKSALGIHSPSTLFRDEVGAMIAKGIGVGFEDELKDVYKDMQNAVDLETSKISSNIELGNANRSISQMINANASFEGTIPIQVDLDGEVVWENQQKVSQRKNLQYGGIR